MDHRSLATEWLDRVRARRDVAADRHCRLEGIRVHRLGAARDRLVDGRAVGAAAAAAARTAGKPGDRTVADFVVRTVDRTARRLAGHTVVVRADRSADRTAGDFDVHTVDRTAVGRVVRRVAATVDCTADGRVCRTAARMVRLYGGFEVARSLSSCWRELKRDDDGKSMMKGNAKLERWDSVRENRRDCQNHSKAF